MSRWISLPNLSKLSQNDDPNRYEPYNEPDQHRAQDTVFAQNDVLSLIRENLIKGNNAAEVCEVISRYCATRKANCNDDEVWSIALSAFNIDTQRKRDRVTQILLNMQRFLFPRLSDHQIFNIICARLHASSRHRTDNYNIPNISVEDMKWLTVKTQIKTEITPEQGSVIRLYRQENHSSDELIEWFWRIMAVVYSPPSGVRYDVRRLPWHEDMPKLTQHDVLEWVETTYSDRHAAHIVGADEYDDEIMQAIWAKFAPEFGFDYQDILPEQPLWNTVEVVHNLSEWIRTVSKIVYDYVFMYMQSIAGNPEMVVEIDESGENAYDNVVNWKASIGILRNPFGILFGDESDTVTVRAPREWAIPNMSNISQYKRSIVCAKACVFGIYLYEHSLHPRLDATKNLLMENLQPLFEKSAENTMLNKDWGIITHRALVLGFVDDMIRRTYDAKHIEYRTNNYRILLVDGAAWLTSVPEIATIIEDTINKLTVKLVAEAKDTSGLGVIRRV